MILTDASGRLIGVQVKRYKGNIKAEQIHAFTGALLLVGHTRGIFVTTSEYQPGAVTTTMESALHGIRIDLVNAAQFSDALRISQRRPYQEFEQWEAAIGEVKTTEYRSEFAPAS